MLTHYNGRSKISIYQLNKRKSNMLKRLNSWENNQDKHLGEQVRCLQRLSYIHLPVHAFTLLITNKELLTCSSNLNNTLRQVNAISKRADIQWLPRCSSRVIWFQELLNATSWHSHGINCYTVSVEAKINSKQMKEKLWLISMYQ